MEDVAEDPNLTAVYSTCCEEDSRVINRRDCQETTSTTTDNKIRTTEKVKTQLSKTDHLSLLIKLYGSRMSECIAHETISASVHRTITDSRRE